MVHQQRGQLELAKLLLAHHRTCTVRLWLYWMLLVGGCPLGTAPPLALDLVLAKLTYLVADVNPRGEGFLLYISHLGVQVMHPKVSRVGNA